MNQDENMKDGKYEEALERARKGMAIDEIFPELHESEDERIRKEIIDWMKGGTTYDLQENKEKWIAYLEKQKEQKPVQSDTEKELVLHDTFGYEQAEKDVWKRIEKYLSKRNATDLATVGWILNHIEEYKKKIMEEE